jgi:molybdate transport system substrate-binding protein
MRWQADRGRRARRHVISADLDWMDYVDQRRLLMPDTRANRLRNTLVLIAPASINAALAIGPKFGLAAALWQDKLAMANPDSVPAGKYGKAALEKLGVWPAVEKKVARAENVRAAMALVSRGEAPFGIVYATDALSDKGVRIVDTFRRTAIRRSFIRRPCWQPAKSPAGKPLLDYLRSPAARMTWEKFGFGTVQ